MPRQRLSSSRSSSAVLSHLNPNIACTRDARVPSLTHRSRSRLSGAPVLCASKASSSAVTPRSFLSTQSAHVADLHYFPVRFELWIVVRHFGARDNVTGQSEALSTAFFAATRLAATKNAALDLGRHWEMRTSRLGNAHGCSIVQQRRTRVPSGGRMTLSTIRTMDNQKLPDMLYTTWRLVSPGESRTALPVARRLSNMSKICPGWR